MRSVVLSAFLACTSAVTLRDCSQCCEDTATALWRAVVQEATNSEAAALCELQTLSGALAADLKWSSTTL